MNAKQTDTQAQVLSILADVHLTHEQRVNRLAAFAENLLPFPESPVTAEFERLAAQGILHDMEGHAPYVPRYILPDYQLFLKQGSEFLRLEAPQTLDEAIWSLLILYRHVPSVTNFPVYLGNLGDLLEPYCADLSDDDIRRQLRGFLIQLDRTFGDSFVHMNIGPQKTRVADIALDLVAELQNAIPNMSLLYDPDITPDDFAAHAAATALVSANPAFAFDRAYKADFGAHPYGIASCYNGLPLCGGAFTLQRLMLGAAAKSAASVEDFFGNVLPHAATTLCGFLEARIRFLVEDTAFFKSSFLVQEGLIKLDNFVGLFGLVGLAECVDTLMQLAGKDLHFGPDEEANQMGVRVMDTLEGIVNSYEIPYSPIWGNRLVLHAQVGLGGEPEVTPGVRIPIGRELPLYEHLRQGGLFHKYFPTGVGDIFPFDVTAKRNPQALVDIAKGAFAVGMRYLSFYASDSDLIRVTGYLVKRSEVEALASGKKLNAVNDMSLGQTEKFKEMKTLERKVRSVG